MKKFLKNLFLFSSIALFGYLVLLITWGMFLPKSFSKNLKSNIEYGFLKNRLQEADTTSNVDVLIVGSSHAYRGYDTRIFNKQGIKAFNLGSSAQTPIQTKMVLEKYLNKMNPKVVLFDVYPEVFCLDGAESTLDFINNSKKIESSILTSGFTTKNMKVYNTLFFKLFEDFFQNKSQILGAETKTEKYISGGFVQTEQTSIPKIYNSKTKNIFLNSQILAFNDILELFKKKNIKFLMVQSPLRKNFYNSLSNNSEIDAFFISKGHYFNFNNLMSFEEVLFSDERHLNQNGVTKFNLELLKIVNFHQYLKPTQ